MKTNQWPTHLKIVAAMTLFFGMCAFTLAVWDAGHSTAKNGNRADHHTQEYRKQADRDIKNKCTSSDVPTLSRCIKEIVESTNEHERDEDDLHAQRDMAKWALLMLAATIAAAFAAFIGVVFIWNDTRVARKIGQAQVRAYLSVESASYELGGNYVDLKVQIKNTGQSPARNVGLGGTIVHYEYIPKGEDGIAYKSLSKVVEPRVIPDIQASSKTTHSVVFIYAIREHNPFSPPIEQGGTPSIAVRLLWNDVFGDQQCIAAIVKFNGSGECIIQYQQA